MEQTPLDRFRQMADANPNDELAWFSLGRALLDDGQSLEAIDALDRCVKLNPRLPRAWQLLGVAHLARDEKDKAIAAWTQGYTAAAGREDAQLVQEFTRMLTNLGAPVPTTPGAAARVVAEGQVSCSRCSQVAPRMPSAPFRNRVGDEILERVCGTCWADWLKVSTKVINEMRLPLSDPAAQAIWENNMREFLGLPITRPKA